MSAFGCVVQHVQQALRIVAQALAEQCFLLDCDDPFFAGFCEQVVDRVQICSAIGRQIQLLPQQGVEAVPGVTKCSIELTFEPEWDRSMLSEEARVELGLDYEEDDYSKLND